MPVTTLDPRPALIVIDLQQALLAGDPPPPVLDVVHNARALAGAFRQRGLPVVLVKVNGTPPGRTDANPTGAQRSTGWTDVLTELDAQPTDHLVTKQRWSAFAGTDLDAHLRAHGVTQVVLAGVATSLGVESTARHALDAGYHVTFATDAMLDRTPDAHRHAITQLFPLIGETGPTQDILTLLNGASA